MDCQPTYEELKPEKDVVGFLKKLNCQPTYEELKHRIF